MRDGGHQIVLQLVESHQPRHVLQHDGRSGDCPLLGVERSRPRQQPAIAHVKRLFQPAGQVGAFSGNDMRAHLLDRVAQIGIDPGQGPLAGLDLQLPLGALVHVQERTVRGDHQDGIGKAVDGRLGCLLRLEQLSERAAAVLAQLVGHGSDRREYAAGQKVASRNR